MRLSLLFVTCLLGACATTGPRTIQPFTTDGCTLFPEGNWHDCCVAHDRDYWCGGDADQRRASDLRLRQCIAEHGHPGVAAIAHAGVRLGGVPGLPTYWRWGYGWPYGQGYRPPPGACVETEGADHLPSPKPAR